MATAVIMPRQGQSVESCIIGKWHKQQGETVAIGDTLFTYETDKATFDEQAKVAGTLIAVFCQEGDDVPVLTPVCAIGDPGEDISGLVPNAVGAHSAPAAAGSETGGKAGMAADHTDAANMQERVPEAGVTRMTGAVSPRAKALAAQSGADLSAAQGSGPQGRVIERDVRQLIAAGKMMTSAADQPQAAVEVESWTEKHTNIRKVIARSMQQSLATMAQLTLNASFDASDILALRSRLKKSGSAGLKAELGFPFAEQVPTINDIIVYAAARVLLRHPCCNAHYDDEKMTHFNHVHMGVAVDTPRGLMVPTVRAADTLPIQELSRQIKELAAACQQGTINPDLLKGGTFTVTNLGTLDVESFTPVINPPQTCVLGVCSIVSRIREQDGQLVAYPAMGLSLTFDHRAVDGAPAARFLKDLKIALEHFSLFMLQ